MAWPSIDQENSKCRTYASRSVNMKLIFLGNFNNKTKRKDVRCSTRVTHLLLAEAISGR